LGDGCGRDNIEAGSCMKLQGIDLEWAVIVAIDRKRQKDD
jgi:hypothetical protein